jgi:hypothetical protein
MDLALFQLMKDQLLIKNKWLKNYLEFTLTGLSVHHENMIRYSKRDEELQEEINKKVEKLKKDEVSEYDSFLGWLFILKKYYGSEIDRSNTLAELVVATNQMMKSYTVKTTETN